jgi:hypothetical protein
MYARQGLQKNARKKTAEECSKHGDTLCFENKKRLKQVFGHGDTLCFGKKGKVKTKNVFKTQAAAVF